MSSDSDEEISNPKKERKKTPNDTVEVESDNGNLQEACTIAHEEVVMTNQRKRQKESQKITNQTKRMKGLNYRGIRKRQGQCIERSSRIMSPPCGNACENGKFGRRCKDIDEDTRTSIFQAF